MAIDDRLDLAVSLGRDDGGDTSSLQVGQDEVGVVSLVGEQDAIASEMRWMEWSSSKSNRHPNHA